jgi:hypothetical protein
MSYFIRMTNDFELQLASIGPCEYPCNSKSLVMKVPGQEFHFRRVHGFGDVVTLKVTNIARIFTNEAGCWAQTRYYCGLVGSLRV